jgi:hypothetical protein
MFVLWMGVVAVDTVALQCGGQPLCADRQVWLRFFNDAFFVNHPERRLVVGLIVPVVIVLLLLVLAGWRSADAYERYQNLDAEHSDTKPDKGDHPLRDGSIWRTFHAVRGMALLHSAAAIAGIAACGAFGIWQVADRGEGLSLERFLSQWSIDHILVYGAVGLLVAASYRVALDKVPREEPETARHPKTARAQWGWAWGLVGGAAAMLLVVVLRGLIGSASSSLESSGDYWGFGHAAFAIGSVVMALLVPLVLLLWMSRRRDAAYGGFGPFVTMALAGMVASTFVAGSIQWATDWLGDPSDSAILASDLAEVSTRLDSAIDGTLPECQGSCPESVIRQAASDYVIALDDVQQAPLWVPTGFDIYSVLIFVLLGLMAAYAAGLEGWLRWKKVPYTSCPSGATHDELISVARGRSRREERRWRKDIARNTRSSPRNIRIHRIAGWALVPAGVVAAVFLGSYWWDIGSVVPWFAGWLEGPGAWALKSSRWAIAAAVVAAGIYVQRSYRDPTRRRALGGVWDIATFWPRSYHPFAPPTYSARAVPELRARIKELLGDGATMLVVSSHSQGVPISMAAIAQLEEHELSRIAFLSHGSPTGALYGAFFPEYYGPQRVKQFADLLIAADAGGGTVRWRNIWRITDWTGGYAFPPPRLDLDANVDCTGVGRYRLWMAWPPGATQVQRHAMDEVASMAAEVEVLWCDPHRDAEVSAGDPLPPSVGHHTYLTDDGYPRVCRTLTSLLRDEPSDRLGSPADTGQSGQKLPQHSA